MEILLAILEIIIILGVLISIHEAGHLSMAKAFGVYCFEYSIGFGPAIIHRKRKKGETYFSLRAIPLGGYVSMYGEDEGAPEGYDAPDPSRSLNAIAKWKKCIVLVAGVFLNFVLGLVLIFVSDIAFPQYYSAYQSALVDDPETTVLYTPVSLSGEPLSVLESYIEEHPEDGFAAEEYYLDIPLILNGGTSVLLSDEVYISNSSEPYVALYTPSTLLKNHDLASSISFYLASEEVGEDMKEQGIDRLPDPEKLSAGESYLVSNADPSTVITVNLTMLPINEDGLFAENLEKRVTLPFKFTIESSDDGQKLSLPGFEIQAIKQWLGWNGAWRQWASDVPEACGAIVKGFASLFSPGGFQNLSGIVGMTAALPNIQATGGVAMIFYFAGLLSINLAFFNLLPFPGLDGWALLVTVIEGVSKRKVPAKAQTIMSIIGMVLLFALMIAVTVKDIIQLF